VALSVPPIRLHTPGGEFLLVLLAALVDLSDRIPSKREVENQIQKAGYLNLPPDHLTESYDSKSEAKWKTLLAYARRNAVDRGHMNPLKARDAWEISDKGRSRFEELQQKFRDGSIKRTGFEFLSAAFFERLNAHS
jgi:hypothetical protein